MRLIDTHCHLSHRRLHGQVDAVLARARAAGLVGVIAATATVADTRASAQLAAEHSGVWHTAGIHPHDAKDATDAALADVERLAGGGRCVAVGEIGLDYHYDYSPRDMQRRAFAAQLALAARLGKPVVVHTREAFADTLAVLAEAGVAGERLVFHSFTGPPAETRQVLDLGATVSFSGIATFAKAEEIRQSVRVVPADRILVETDAPFLSPEPVRKIKTNEPAHVAHVARRLAQVRDVEADAFAEQTTANAQRIFGIDE